MDANLTFIPPPSVVRRDRGEARAENPGRISAGGGGVLDTPSARVRLETHGCKLNQADTQALARQFARAGYSVVPEGESAEIYVLNTCTVTHVADRKARQAIRAARRRDPAAFIVATGCYAQRAADDLRAMPEIDLVVGNVDKRSLVPLVGAEYDGGPPSACAVGEDEALAPALKLRARAMIKIQEGCDQVCAYCIVPKVRGRERSVPVAELLTTANAYAALGCREIVLTGTQLGSYGFDLEGESLTTLLRALLDGADVPRIRVSSLQPRDISDGLLALWAADSRLCPHFHVPLQSGSDAVLARMRRRYDSAEFLAAVRRIRRAVDGVAITADAIAGFPGETDDDFRRTVEVCEEAELASVHVFPYSPRPGTSAAHYDDHLDPKTKAARAKTLAETAAKLSVRFRNRQIGTVRPVLWERADPTEGGRAVRLSGLTDNYIRTSARTHAEADAAPPVNQIAPAELTGLDGEGMSAKIVPI